MQPRKKDQGLWKRGLDLRKKVVSFIKEAKKLYVTEKLRIHRKDSKKYWKAVQVVLPNSRSTGIEVIFDPESNEIVGGCTAANVINNYFSNIGKNLADGLSPTVDEF